MNAEQILLRERQKEVHELYRQQAEIAKEREEMESLHVILKILKDNLQDGGESAGEQK